MSDLAQVEHDFIADIRRLVAEHMTESMRRKPLAERLPNREEAGAGRDELKRRKLSSSLATRCAGGGLASALIIERM